jgi:hypothetical protein
MRASSGGIQSQIYLSWSVVLFATPSQRIAISPASRADALFDYL